MNSFLVFFRLLLIAASSVFLVSDLAAQKSSPNRIATGEPEWLLVHGDTQSYGDLSLQRIGEVYLGQHNWGSCHERDFSPSFAGSILVVGRLGEVGLAAELSGVAADDPHYLKRRLEPGLGLVVAAKRQAGARYCIFTGVDDDAVLQCMTTPVKVSMDRAFVIRSGQILSSWPDSSVVRGGPAARRPAVHLPGVVALQQLVDEDEVVSEPLSRAEAVDRAARAQMGYGTEWALLGAAGNGGPNWMHDRLAKIARDQTAALLASAAWLSDMDLHREIDARWHQVVHQLGPSRQVAPAVFVLLDSAQGTNARTSGIDPRSQRPRVVLNLACFPDLRSFRIALVHEFIHVLQIDEAGNLAKDPMLVEGVASFLTRELMPQISHADALMWTDAQYELALQHEVAAAQGYRALAEANSPELASWFVLGAQPLGSKGGQKLPDRMGYFLGYRAAHNWYQLRDSVPPSALLKLKTGELNAYLADKISLDE